MGWILVLEYSFPSDGMFSFQGMVGEQEILPAGIDSLERCSQKSPDDSIGMIEPCQGTVGG
jgi:hypothetical protein